MSAGAPKAPITYEGPYDATRTYLPRQVVTDGATRTGYLSTATSTGVVPAADPTAWLPLGGGGGGGVTGTATYRFTFTAGAITSENVALIHATGIELLDSTGDPGVYSAIPDGILTDPGVYVAWSGYYIRATTNALSTDSHAVNYGNVDTKLILGANVWHTHNNVNVFDIAEGGSGLITPCFQIYCPAGTNRVYQLDRNRVDVTMIRWDRPT